MERLTTKKVFNHYNSDKKITTVCVDGYTQICEIEGGYFDSGLVEIPHYFLVGEAVDKLAHYEDLEEQGLLLKLPCKMGDEVYVLRRTGEYAVSWFEIKEEKFTLTFYERYSSAFKKGTYNHLLGGYIFLTKAEAEKALEEMEK